MARTADCYCQHNTDGSYQGVVHYTDGQQPEWNIQPPTWDHAACETWAAQHCPSSGGLPGLPDLGWFVDWWKNHPDWAIACTVGAVVILTSVDFGAGRTGRSRSSHKGQSRLEHWWQSLAPAQQDRYYRKKWAG